MRNVGSMVEFKQIVGRGTRIYDDKDYFTIVDFYGNDTKFEDPEWDGEPQEIEQTDVTDPTPETVNVDNPIYPVPDEGDDEGVAEPPSMHTSSSDLSPPEETVVRLADGKNRTIMYTSETKFYMDGKVVAPKQFIEILFGELPELFKNEEDLREQWSDPRTREILLQGLAERGFEETKLQALKTLCDAENSDIYDVLRYTAYARDTMTRTERAGLLREYYLEQLDEDEREFVGYVLAIYESRGEQELRMDNLTGLVRLRYRTLRNATYHLGSPAEIVSDFLEFQRELYQAVDVT